MHIRTHHKYVDHLPLYRIEQIAARQKVILSRSTLANWLLRTVASKHQIEVHGVLWAIDEIHKAETAKVSELLDALKLFESDPTIFRLPSRDLKALIRRYTPVSYKKIKLNLTRETTLKKQQKVLKHRFLIP